MRKQYHFRESERGLLAWDVHRLIELTRNVEPSEVELSEIREIDEPYWYDADDSLPTCRDLMEHMRLVEATDLAYPIILSPDGRVMDGMHRVVKALLQERTTIMATRLSVMPAPDYIGCEPDDLPY
ncbi:hypothetical protein LU699_17905 [Luteimonas fraxinea]|uniref:Chromosome partitioning protein ParB n=1 Tax=Luteimonas fraxinea TaxID=2901869 RepID=A0ABS8UBU3_9GAMM|nr:hypothetical protein [Luteimonas fraxinea]MCD9096457.1 hypothetical protein [Luteimonas fraxinea]MCD9125798.1 hypothetical protein [Luteimonas fraxinea]UHH10101.1 hypothetical protein LU699_17905 [Luteimonas fraxinea]